MQAIVMTKKFTWVRGAGNLHQITAVLRHSRTNGQERVQPSHACSKNKAMQAQGNCQNAPTSYQLDQGG
jgi:hypothetical protein